ncbi:hypothetical protein AKJ16_DCAP04543 [Drosera capensis]
MKQSEAEVVMQSPRLLKVSNLISAIDKVGSLPKEVCMWEIVGCGSLGGLDFVDDDDDEGSHENGEEHVSLGLLEQDHGGPEQLRAFVFLRRDMSCYAMNHAGAIGI